MNDRAGPVAGLVLVAVVAVVVLGAGIQFAIAATHQARNRGYRGAGFFVSGAMFLGAFGPVLLLPQSRSGWSMLLEAMLLVGGAGACAVVAWAVVPHLPARPKRRLGTRPKPRGLEAMGYLGMVGSVVGMVAAILGDDAGAVYQLSVAGRQLSSSMAQLRRRSLLQASEMPRDVVRFVLYLRPFRTEEVPWFRLPDSQSERIGYNGIRRSRVALDEFLAAEAPIRIGPVLALGDPGDHVPPPGALRIYLTHGDWQAELGHLADAAAAIVMCPGRTQAVRWELEYIVGKRLWGKLLVITPQARADSPMARFSRFVNREGTWAEFAAELRDCGLGPPDRDPGPGAVVGFGPDASAVVVARDVRLSSDVVTVIDDWTTPDDVRDLLRDLQGDVAVRDRAAAALGRRHDPDTAVRLVQRLFAEPSTEIQDRIMGVIRGMGESAVAPLAGLLGSTSTEVVMQGCVGLALLGGPGLPQLLRLSSDPAVDLRIAAVSGLLALYNHHDDAGLRDRAVSRMTEMVREDTSELVRGATAAILLAVPDPRVVAALRHARDHDRAERVRAVARESLGVLHEKDRATDPDRST